MGSIEDKGRLPRKEYFSTFTYDFFLIFLAAIVLALSLIIAGALLYRNMSGTAGAIVFFSGIAVLVMFIPLSLFIFGEKVVVTGKALRLVRKNLEVTILFGRITELKTLPLFFRLFNCATISDGENRITLSSLKYPEYEEILNLVKVGRKQATSTPAPTRE